MIICQTGMPPANCATGIFTNLGTGEVSSDELVTVNADSGMTPGAVTIDDDPTATVGNSATATWNDLNGDTNIDVNNRIRLLLMVVQALHLTDTLYVNQGA